MCPGRRIVLHIIDSGGVYGIEKMIISLLPKLKGNNYEAGLISLRPLSDPKNDISIRLKNNEISVFKPHFLDKIGLRTILYLYKIFHQYKPAIIHLHGYKATILGGGGCVSHANTNYRNLSCRNKIYARIG